MENLPERQRKINKTDDPEYFKKYYQEKKATLLEYAKQRVICTCGRPVCRSHMGRHIKTTIHKNVVELMANSK